MNDKPTERAVPVINLAPNLRGGDSDKQLISDIAKACSTAGFFQVINHGIEDSLVQEFRSQCQAYFTTLSPEIKHRQRRHDTNSRGYFDDELTKQRLDWKQALDVGVPGSRDWTLPDDDPLNACLDGFNQLPSETELPGFRSTIVRYFQACTELSDRVARLMEAGIIGNVDTTTTSDNCIVEDLKRHHTSYLRMNYYPVCPGDAAVSEQPTDSPLGISPHKDAGFLTVLLQDDDCHSLQVWYPEEQEWRQVHPLPGALTINTGDMAQIWSNGQYKAPLHRVLTNVTKVRYSAPFFYNPGYDSYIRPVVSCNAEALYHPCLWGYFRSVRFAGDLTDLGVEIQVDDFKQQQDDGENGGNSTEGKHLERQSRFAELARFDEPFSVEGFRDLLTG